MDLKEEFIIPNAGQNNKSFLLLLLSTTVLLILLLSILLHTLPYINKVNTRTFSPYLFLAICSIIFLLFSFNSTVQFFNFQNNLEFLVKKIRRRVIILSIVSFIISFIYYPPFTTGLKFNLPIFFSPYAVFHSIFPYLFLLFFIFYLILETIILKSKNNIIASSIKILSFMNLILTFILMSLILFSPLGICDKKDYNCVAETQLFLKREEPCFNYDRILDRDLCLIRVAALSRDSNYCSKTSLPFMDCFGRAFLIKCKLNDNMRLQSCINSCEKLNDKDMRRTCYRQILDQNAYPLNINKVNIPEYDKIRKNICFSITNINPASASLCLECAEQLNSRPKCRVSPLVTDDEIIINSLVYSRKKSEFNVSKFIFSGLNEKNELKELNQTKKYNTLLIYMIFNLYCEKDLRSNEQDIVEWSAIYPCRKKSCDELKGDAELYSQCNICQDPKLDMSRIDLVEECGIYDDSIRKLATPLWNS